MSPSGQRTAKEVLHRSDLLWLALLAYSKAISSNDSESPTTSVLTLIECLEVVGQRFVHDGQGEAGELATVIQKALGEEIPLIIAEDGHAFAVLELTWLRSAVEVLHRPPGMTYGQLVETLPTRSHELPRIWLRGWTDHPTDDGKTTS